MAQFDKHRPNTAKDHRCGTNRKARANNKRDYVENSIGRKNNRNKEGNDERNI